MPESEKYLPRNWIQKCDWGDVLNWLLTELADAMYRAATMPPDERIRRMQRMREHLERNNVYRWGGKVLSELLKFDFPENI